METTNTLEPEIKVEGMGAIVQPEGVFFRVWAPNAHAVSVAGSFNEFNKEAHLMEQEEDGYWAGMITDAKKGDDYKYVLQTEKGDLFRNDPYARAVTNSVGNSIIYDPSDFDWGNEDFNMPTWNKLVIYELHTGTFNVKEKGIYFVHFI